MSNYEKTLTLSQLEMGDIVRCTNGHEYEFIRLKKTKFIGKRKGSSYDIPVGMFVELVKKAEKTAFDPHTLKTGDLLYILSSKQEPLVFRFKYMINTNRVMAENPVTGSGIRIDAGLVKGSVSDLVKSEA